MKKNTFGSRILKLNILIILWIIVLCIMTILVSEWWCACFWLISLIGISLVYYRKVYIPLKNMEETVRLLGNMNPDVHLDLTMDSEHLKDALSQLIEEMHVSLKKEHQAELLNHELMYAQLQSQINPHFLYNTLESIRGQAVIDDNYRIADMTEALAKYFRYTISRKEEQVTIKDELENIKNYVYIQQYRFDDRFDFNIYCHDDSELCMRSAIPKMTLQPIVENAIFYGMENKLEKGHITIHVEATKDIVTLVISDDGVGMDGNTLEQLNKKISGMENDTSSKNNSRKGNGVALKNINQRLKLLFGTQYGLYVASTKNLGTEVEVRLPLMIGEDYHES